MILVTGTPRSGTSLMMQTLQILGYDLIGEKHNRMCSHDLNPKGSWELEPESLAAGIRGNYKEYFKKAIKVFSSHLMCVDPYLVHGVILCLRDKSSAIPSIIKLLETHITDLDVEPTEESAELIYDSNWNAACNYIAVIDRPCLIVTYENMIEDKKGSIERINSFVCGNNKIKKAIENIGV